MEMMDEVNMTGYVSRDFPYQEFTRYFDFMRHWGDIHEKFVQCASPRFADLPASGRREFLVDAVAEDDLLAHPRRRVVLIDRVGPVAASLSVSNVIVAMPGTSAAIRRRA